MSKVFGVSSAVLLSRILGFFRVRLEAEILGGGAVASAWHLVFTYANIFRRILGEGALGNALMPIVAELDKNCGKESVKGALAVVFPVLGAILALIVILCSAGALIVGNYAHGVENYQLRLICILMPLLMPYVIFICMTGVITSVLNYAKCFVVPAFCSLLMNIFLVGGLTWGYFTRCGETKRSLEEFLIVLSILFLISGVLQLGMMLIQLKMAGFFPDFSRWRKHTDVLKKLWHLALPGLIGASALQISLLVDRNIARYVNDQAVSALTYVDRLIDLPIGLFAVGMGQVFMARMSASVAAGDLESLKEDMNYGLRQVFFLSIPLACSVCFFHELMLKILCLGGRYTMDDLNAARTVALFYGGGIPFFCALKIIQPAFFARKDMKTPLYCSLSAIGVNIVLSIALSFTLAQGGIALATVISSCINCFLLSYHLKKAGLVFDLKEVGTTLLRSVFAAVSAGVICKLLLDRFYTGTGRFADICALGVTGAVFGIIYLGIVIIGRGREFSEMLGRFRKKNA